MKSDTLIINYSAIITYRNGENRGYTIQAGSQKEAFEKLMNHVNFNLVRHSMLLNVNDFKTKKEVLQWYVQMNAGGTPHSAEEI